MLNVEVAGDGKPVVLVHAGVCDSRMWDPQWPALTSSHRVVRYDMRGFGRSPAATGPHAPAADLLGLIDELELDPVVLVGASFGGRVALDAAVARPELMRALILLDPALPDHDWSDTVQAYGDEEDEALERGDLDAAVEANLRMWVDGHGRPPGTAPQRVRALVGEMQRRAFELQMAAPDVPSDALVADLGERLSEITAPTLVLVGEYDVEDFKAIADRIRRAVAGARRERVPDAAHLPSLEQPEYVTPRMLDFLSDLPSPR